MSLDEIRNHLFKAIPGLKDVGISIDTVHRLMLSPRKGTIQAKQFKGLVNVQVPHKQNDAVLHEHVHHHYCSSLVATVNEMFEHFGELRLSCDDKNKINVGTSAVSRYHQLSSFFLVGSSPNLPDHDFSYANSKLIPSGYLVMEKKSSPVVAHANPRKRSRSLSLPARGKQVKHYIRRCCSEPRSRRSLPVHLVSRRRSRSLPGKQTLRSSSRRSSSEPRNFGSSETVQPPAGQYKIDNLGRLRVIYPCTGRLYVVNRAGRVHQSNALAHANDLRKILQREMFVQDKHSVCLVTGNGPDYSMKSLQTVLYFGRLWRDSNCDVLVQTSYAPGHSAHNMIEHAWAPLSRKLAGVTLPITLEGEDKPPCQQTALSAVERRQKEVKVFNNALNNYWDGKTYDGFPISSTGKPAEELNSPYSVVV